MAQPIKKVERRVLSEAEKQQQSLDQVVADVANSGEAFQQSIRLLQELHDIGVLQALQALLQAKEQVAKIALDQVTRPSVTNTINNVMGATELLGNLDPNSTKKVLGSLTQGLETAGAKVEQGASVGLFDLVKALRDPDINRALTFGLGFLKGLGQGLK